LDSAHFHRMRKVTIYHICKAIKRNKIKIMHLLPQIFFVFLVENNKTEKQQGHAYGKRK
jgi:hypothetical protein